MQLFCYGRSKPAQKKCLALRMPVIFLIAFFSLVSARGISQTVNLSAKAVPLKTAFDAIKAQTGYVFFYDVALLQQANPVTVELKNATVEKALNEIFKSQPFNWIIENKTITITRKQEPAAKKIATAENAGSVPVTIDVKGRLVTDSGENLAFAAVAVFVNKVKAGGTVSDAKGNFELKKINENAVLQITSLSTDQIDVPVKGRTDLGTIITKSRIAQVEPVVITGMQNKKKSAMVGSVSVATSKDLENAGVTTFEKALEGKIPGVYIRSLSGRPGETGQIIIRGINSLTGSVDPLYVLDGMPLQQGDFTGGVNTLITNGIGNIPPENIESITILKDATASSIYGSKAANGVVVITTKNGQVGNDYVNYSGKFGVTMRPNNKFNFMNSAEKVQFEKGIIDDFHPPYESGGRVVQLYNLLVNGSITQAQYDAQLASLGQINTNWVNELYRVASSQSHNISLSGGNTKTTYFTSFNFQSSQGTLIQNRFQAGGITMKLTRAITNKLLLKFNLYTTLKKNEEGQAGMDPFRYAIFANPYEKPFNDDGSYAKDNTYRSIPNTIATSAALYYSDFNIIRELRENKLSTVYGNVRGQFSLDLDFLKHFKYTGNVAGSYSSQQDKDESYGGTYRSWVRNWLTPSSNGGLGVLPDYNRGFMQQSSGRTVDYTIRNTIEYNNTFGGKHFVQGFFASEFGAISYDRFKNFSPVYLQDYGITGYPTWDLVSASRYSLLRLDSLGGTYTSQNRNASFIGSAAYVYDNRYVFNGNIRSDGVDILGSQNQFQPLWSVGTKWNAHNEKFMRQYKWINRLVLSAGYGFRGSINRSVFPFNTYTIGTNVYGGLPVASAFSYGNPVIRWEKKQEKDFGLELSLFNARVNTEIRYFDEKVIDLLDNTVIPPSTGRSVATINNGTLTNRGYEISARVEVIKNKDWLWEVGGNFTQVKNRLTNVYDKVPPSSSSLSTRNIQDYPVNGWFGFKFSNVDPATGNIMVYAQKINNNVDATGNVTTTYTDQLINLSKITSADLATNYATYYLGHRDPEYYGGFNTRLNYKSFEMTASFVYGGGNMITSFNDRREGPSGFVGDILASRTNRLKENLYRWRQGGDITNIPSYSYTNSQYTNYLISTDIEKGSYLKCNELSLSWRAKKAFLARTAMKTLKVTLVGSNLFILSSYSGTDPETQSPFTYPNTRNFTLSLNVGF